MTYFKNFNKTICASVFTKPNNYLLRHCQAPIYLCTSNDPSIDHLHSVKALFKTISKLESHAQNAGYKTIVKGQLQNLRKSAQQYKHNVLKYVQTGGRLTGAGLANLYAVADKLDINDKWLEIYAQPQIPHLIRYMNVDNLKDLKDGLSKYKGNSDFANLVDKQLSTRNTGEYTYVKRAVNEVAQFQQAKAPTSSNFLINAIESNQSTLLYHIGILWRYEWKVFNSLYLKKPTYYSLDA